MVWWWLTWNVIIAPSNWLTKYVTEEQTVLKFNTNESGYVDLLVVRLLHHMNGSLTACTTAGLEHILMNRALIGLLPSKRHVRSWHHYILGFTLWASLPNLIANSRWESHLKTIKSADLMVALEARPGVWSILWGPWIYTKHQWYTVRASLTHNVICKKTQTINGVVVMVFVFLLIYGESYLHFLRPAEKWNK